VSAFTTVTAIISGGGTSASSTAMTTVMPAIITTIPRITPVTRDGPLTDCDVLHIQQRHGSICNTMLTVCNELTK
jgi:hypothetical protein